MNHIEAKAPLVRDTGRIGLRAPAAKIEQSPTQRQVTGADQEESERGSPVAPRPADLLVVRLDRSRRPQMDHGPNIRAVDPHAEGVRGHHDLEPTFSEVTLHDIARPPVEARVVRAGAPAALRQPLAFFIGLLARGRVDDGRPAPSLRALECLREGAVHEALPLAAANDL